MHRRTVEELMTRDVVRARRDMPFKEIVKLLAENDVTAVPVVDEVDRPIVVVSEADLLHKSSAQADPSGPDLGRGSTHGGAERQTAAGGGRDGPATGHRELR